MNRWVALAVALGVLVGGCSDDGPRPVDASDASRSEAADAATTDVSTANAAADEVEERLEDFQGTYPGALVLLRVGHETRFVSAGRADRRKASRITERHRFQVGSVTKTMVATVVLQLVEDGELDPTDSVASWLPGLVPRGDRITIEQLLSHRSGLYNFTDSPDFRWTGEWEPVEIVRLATSEEPVFAPDTRSGYSNTNYILLGLIVEQVTGKDLADVMQEQVFDPTGMTDTSLDPDRVTDPPRVRGYDGRRDVTLDDLTNVSAAGGVVSSARDLDAFLNALTGGQLLESATFQDMARPRGGLANRGGLEYGLGLTRNDTRCSTVLGHGGGLPGFLTEAWTSEDGQRSVVAMVNDLGSSDVLAGLVFSALCG